VSTDLSFLLNRACIQDGTPKPLVPGISIPAPSTICGTPGGYMRKPYNHSTNLIRIINSGYVASLLSPWHEGHCPSFGLASLCHLGDATTYTAFRHELEWSFNIHTEIGQRSLYRTCQASSVDLMHCSLIAAKAPKAILDINWFQANRHTSTHQWRQFIKHIDVDELSPLLHTTCRLLRARPLETHLSRSTAQLTLFVSDLFCGHAEVITH